LLEQI
jgi:speckle-type POZ protein